MATARPTDIGELSPLSAPPRIDSRDLQRIRRELGFTIRELAHCLGVCTSTVDHWSYDHADIPRPVTLALAYLQRRRVQRKSVNKRRKKARLLKQSLELRPPVKHLFY